MNINFKVKETQIRTLKANDPRFLIRDGFIVAPRAGFEIDSRCPYEYRMVIDECLRNGWLKPVANMTERELIFQGLINE